LKILVVDDNPINQKFLYYSLRNRYEVGVANNGLEAIEMLDKETFNLILMDLSMPIMDGAQATRRIRESVQANYQNIPIIFVTTNDFDNQRERCLSCGANDYMVKPIDIMDLISNIDYHTMQIGKVI
jgi:CheY-like chemotaxis protein